MVTEEEHVRCRESQLDSDAQHLKRCENALKSEAKRVKQRLSQWVFSMCFFMPFR